MKKNLIANHMGANKRTPTKKINLFARSDHGEQFPTHVCRMPDNSLAWQFTRLEIDFC